MTWKGRGFESAIDYVLVNQRARIFVGGMVIDEGGEVDIDMVHNLIILKYAVKEMKMRGDNKFKSRRLSEFKWVMRFKLR